MIWRKASKSGNGGGNCVEEATLPDGSHLVRDSKNPDGARLTVSATTWQAFMTEIKAGRADLPGLTRKAAPGAGSCDNSAGGCLFLPGTAGEDPPRSSSVLKLDHGQPGEADRDALAFT
jgi:Domain of unknown function (DUF397)